MADPHAYAFTLNQKHTPGPSGYCPICPQGRCIFFCASCELAHVQVECNGLFHCPNLLCPGPGGAVHRFQFNQCYTSESVAAWLVWGLSRFCPDPNIASARNRSAERLYVMWKDKFTEEQQREVGIALLALT